MTNIVTKCTSWNAARYERVYNHALAQKLLLEEREELFNAQSVFNKVEVLDAVGDIVFVAIGVLWKASVPLDVIYGFLYEPDLRFTSAEQEQEEAFLIMSEIAHNFMGDFVRTGQKPTVEDTLMSQGCYLAIQSIYNLALPVLRSMGLQSKFYEIVDAICDSNDTKEIKGKVDPSVKANVVKGASYVPPTARLKEILGSVH